MVKYRLVYDREIVTEPAVSKAITETGAHFYIIKVESAEEGEELTVEIVGKDKQIKEAIERLERTGVDVFSFRDVVEIDREKCVDCGACITLCPWYALDFDGDWTVTVDQDKCVAGCSICIPNCPTKAFKVKEIVES